MSETKNLKLFKHEEPLGTNNNKFDIDKALNQNWDKVDEYVEKVNTEITNLQNNKVDKEEGKGLSTNDFTNEEKEKLAGLNNYDDTEIIDLLPKVSNKGESITLENTARAKFTKFRIEGNSKQETRSGKNLINSFYNYSAGYTMTNKGVTFTLLEDGKIRVNGNATGGRATFTFAIPETTIKAGNHVLSQGSEKVQIEAKIGDTYYRAAGSSSNISIVEEQKLQYVALIVNEGLTVNNEVVYAQLEDGTVATEYEQYGAMPSEKFPSEIRNIGDNINIFNKNGTFISYQTKTEVLDTGIKVINLSTVKYASAYTNLGGNELLGKTITLYSDIEESEGATAGVLLYFGTASKPTFGGAIQKINNNSKNAGLWNIPSEFPDDCDRIHLYFYSSDSTEPTANSYVKYTNLKVEVRDTPSPYSDYGCGSTRITASTENLANTEQLYNEMVSFNSKNVRKEIVDKKNCIVFTNESYRATRGFKGLQGKYKKNTQYVVRLKARCYDTSISGSSSLFVQAHNKNGDLIGSDSHNANGATWMQFSFLTNANSSLDYIDFSYGNLTDWCIDLDSFEIYEGTSVKAVDKNEDTDVVIQFNKGQKLMEGDYLAEDGIHHTKTQIVLDGVTNGLKVANVTKHSNNIYYCVINLVKQSINNMNDINGMYCSHFMPHFEVRPGSCYIAGSGLYLVLVLTDQTITTVDAANTWLATQKEKGTPVVIEYKLAEEEIETYTEVQKEAYEQIKNAISYKGQTNIFSTNEIKPIFEVEALADIGLLLNNMQAQILAGGE